MVVEVVAAQVGKDADVVFDRRHPSLCEGVRGDFHRHGFDARIAEAGEVLLDAQRVGGGVARGLQRIQLAVADGAEHRAAGRLREEVDERGFAVRSRHADEFERARGVVVEARGDFAQMRAELFAGNGACGRIFVGRFVGDGGRMQFGVVEVQRVVADAARRQPEGLRREGARVGGNRRDVAVCRGRSQSF